MTAEPTSRHRAIPRETLPFDRVALVLQGGGALGVSQSETRVMTLDTMSQRLVQKAVADMEKLK